MLESVVCNVEESSPASSFLLQVAGRAEYLDPQSKLGDFVYVRECCKHDRDLEFVLLPKAEVARPYRRTVECTLETIVLLALFRLRTMLETWWCA